MVIMALASGLFLSALDVSIVSTTIPTIVADLGTASGYTWIGGAYTLAYAAGAPMWGKISDIFGRKPVLLVAVAIFWLGSLLSALSKDMGMLIASRTIQGIGGGGLVILVNICISDLFSARDRGRCYSL
jgi:MFS family permease